MLRAEADGQTDHAGAGDDRPDVDADLVEGDERDDELKDRC
jgi:hypothetical protein